MIKADYAGELREYLHVGAFSLSGCLRACSNRHRTRPHGRRTASHCTGDWPKRPWSAAYQQICREGDFQTPGTLRIELPTAIVETPCLSDRSDAEPASRFSVAGVCGPAHCSDETHPPRPAGLPAADYPTLEQMAARSIWLHAPDPDILNDEARAINLGCETYCVVDSGRCCRRRTGSEHRGVADAWLPGPYNFQPHLPARWLGETPRAFRQRVHLPGGGFDVVPSPPPRRSWPRRQAETYIAERLLYNSQDRSVRA